MTPLRKAGKTEGGGGREEERSAHAQTVFAPRTPPAPSARTPVRQHDEDQDARRTRRLGMRRVHGLRNCEARRGRSPSLVCGSVARGGGRELHPVTSCSTSHHAPCLPSYRQASGACWHPRRSVAYGRAPGEQARSLRRCPACAAGDVHHHPGRQQQAALRRRHVVRRFPEKCFFLGRGGPPSCTPRGTTCIAASRASTTGRPHHAVCATRRRRCQWYYW